MVDVLNFESFVTRVTDMDATVKLNDYVTKTAGCRYVPNTGSIEKDIKATQAALFTHGPLAVALDANKLSFRDAVNYRR